jgi:hypothetical protein
MRKDDESCRRISYLHFAQQKTNLNEGQNRFGQKRPNRVFVQIDLVSMIFTNSYVSGAQIEINGQIRDLVTVLHFEPFSGNFLGTFVSGSVAYQYGLQPYNIETPLPHEEEDDVRCINRTIRRRLLNLW